MKRIILVFILSFNLYSGCFKKSEIYVNTLGGIYGVSKAEIKLIVDTVKRITENNIVDIFLYGSRVSGINSRGSKITDGSDLDIMIHFRNDYNMSKVVDKLDVKLSELLGLEVDIYPIKTLADKQKETIRITRIGKIIKYDSSKSGLYPRDTFLRLPLN